MSPMKRTLRHVVTITMLLALPAAAAAGSAVVMFEDDFDDNDLDLSRWQIEATSVDPHAWVEETNQRLELDLPRTGRDENVKLRTIPTYPVELASVDMMNGDRYNYLYKQFWLEGELDGWDYYAGITFRDWGSISVEVSYTDGDTTISEGFYLYPGFDQKWWNWLWHLSLEINPDGTVTARASDDRGHDFEGTSTVTFPPGVLFRTGLGAILWRYGTPRPIWFDDLVVTGVPLTTTVAVDIMPEDFPNSVNPRSKGVLPVAILSTSIVAGDEFDFDATQVDSRTVLFGPAGAPIVHSVGHLEDVDGDGDTDLLMHFRTQETGIACGDTSAALTGETFAGDAIEGADSIETVGCK